MKDTIIFLTVWAALSSVSLMILGGFIFLVLTYGLAWLFALPVLFFCLGLCFVGIAEVSIRLS